MEKSTADEKSASPAGREIRVLEIMGCFLVFFAILLLIGVGKSETTGDKVTNLVSALILLTIGAGMFWRGVVHHRGKWLLPLVLFTSLAVAAGVVAFCVSPSSLESRGKAYDAVVKALTSAGWKMRDAVASIALEQVEVFTVIGFILIAAVVWSVRRKTVFEGVSDRKWWRDLRLWTAVIMATQVVIYLLLGTYGPEEKGKSSQGKSGEIHRPEAFPGGSEESSQPAE